MFVIVIKGKTFSGGVRLEINFSLMAQLLLYTVLYSMCVVIKELITVRLLRAMLPAVYWLSGLCLVNRSGTKKQTWPD